MKKFKIEIEYDLLVAFHQYLQHFVFYETTSKESPILLLFGVIYKLIDSEKIRLNIAFRYPNKKKISFSFIEIMAIKCVLEIQEFDVSTQLGNFLYMLYADIDQQYSQTNNR